MFCEKVNLRKSIAAVIIIVMLLTPLILPVPVKASTPPSLDELNAAIDRAKQFIDRLYRVSEGVATLGEYYGCPLIVYIPGEGYIKAGCEDNTVWRLEAESSDCYWAYEVHKYKLLKLIAIDPISGPIYAAVMELEVQEGFDYSYVSYCVKNLFYDESLMPSYVDVYIWDIYVGRASNDNEGGYVGWGYIYDFSKVRSCRYTVRHGSQMGYKLYYELGETAKADALKAVCDQYGFTYDIYDPLFGYSLDQPDDYFYTPQAYHDVDVYDELPRTSQIYPYRSKVGLNRDLYIEMSKQEWLVPTLRAIHILLKYQDPDYVYHEDYYGDITPRQWARWLEQNKWIGYGIAHPKDETVASGVRTAAFLVLEAYLGYVFGDPTSKAYADEAAQVLLNVQVTDYTVRTQEGEYFRPIAQGAFYIAWNQYELHVPRAWYDDFFDWLGMAPEYTGIIPTNAETMLAITQALIVYRNLVYGQ